MRVFFYGTLMDRDVLRLVLGPRGGRLRLDPATLRGYRRVGVRARSYPVVVPDPGGSVDGYLSGEVDRAMYARLVEFEGDEYAPERREVVVENGRACPAWVFVASTRVKPTPHSWSVETWRTRHKKAFLRRHRAAGNPS